jgi:alpha-mannosidase
MEIAMNRWKMACAAVVLTMIGPGLMMAQNAAQPTPEQGLKLAPLGLPETGSETAPSRDLTKQPTLYAVGYAHLDTEWRWEYPQVIQEYLRKTMEDNFKLFDKYPNYTFNFSGANRYRLMKEYFPSDFAKLQEYVKQGRWFPAGSSMEEGDVNAPGAEALIRQILYGNDWFRKELGTSSAEYMLPDCFGFPSSLPSILAHAGVRGFSTQKLSWGSGSYVGGPQSIEDTPVGTPFNVGVWVGPDGNQVIAALNPGGYGSDVTTDLSKPLPAPPPDPAIVELQTKMAALQQKRQDAQTNGTRMSPEDMSAFQQTRELLADATKAQQAAADARFQDDWAARVLNNGKVTGIFADYHYFGTGDIGGAPKEERVARMNAIVSKGTASFPVNGGTGGGRGYGQQELGPEVTAGEGPVQVLSAKADQMFIDITDKQAALLPRYTGELELINHSAGSLTSEGYQKRWIRQQEILADAAEKSSIAAAWLGARAYPMDRLNAAWTLTMGSHFHDLAAGTATPRAYTFAWNDDVIAMNQFADVIKDGTEAVSAGLDTKVKGTPIVVFNPLNIAREDVVEADVKLDSKGARVTGPDGAVVPSQMKDGRVLFVAKAPSVGYVVYDVEAAAEPAKSSTLRVNDHELENEYYRVHINEDGDVSSIFDKKLNKELLASPARLAISYDNPQNWPAWNMDWEQETAAPREYVSGTAKVRVVEDGPARVAVEVTRDTAGSHFVETIRLSAGDAGKRVEFVNAIDWKTKESNLKATFPMTAYNNMATYNWDIGTIMRPTEDPNKFEVPSHQWIDLTDASGTFGGTILTDDKNGSDKPNDHTIRLTLLRTPGTRGGYHDEASQDIGHHDIVFGFAGHADGWRAAQTDWQAQRLNDPLMAFETSKHDGGLGKSFSLLRVSNPRIRVLAVKQAEHSDEVVVRMVELDGKPQADVHVGFPDKITEAREVNGQEQPVGPATIVGGELVTSFTAYQPRTFALRMQHSSTHVMATTSQPVELKYDVAAASDDGGHSTSGFDGKGNALPAEMLPKEIVFNNVRFELAQAATGTPDAITAAGQTIQLPAGHANRVYLLAAATDGDQTATFTAGDKKTELTIQNWGGFIGQWDNRTWSVDNFAQDKYGEMTGLTPGFIKRDDLAWYASHHHNADGENQAYQYSYLFGYSIELPPSATTLTLPNNDKIRILAISVAEEDPQITPAHPLYDVLPSRSEEASVNP